ncbi:MAG: hypothetical protein GX859_04735 [Corynebacterium humireducens]|jgi:hypothetical protein|uniref:Uncharacterized protein n=1 Tax=Corynebacterium humireducens TaxID=1223514 RepID=A0A7X6SUX5_9CORY|nr:hypothetical protein [Corynebacterium humireducens]
MKRVLWVVLGLLAVVILIPVVVLAISWKRAEIDYDQLAYHPVGDQRAWLHPGYAEGFDTLDLPSRPLGFSRDREAVALYDVNEKRLESRDIRSGEARWSVEGVDCSIFPVASGTVYCVDTQISHEGVFSTITGRDIATGAGTPLYAGPVMIRNLEVLGEFEDAIIVSATDAEGPTMLSLRENGHIDWQARIADADLTPSYCEVVSDRVVCTELSSRVTALDARTGEQTVDVRDLVHKVVVLLSDGYYLRPAGLSRGELHTELFNYDGERVSDLVDPHVPRIPGAEAGIRFPSSDLGQDGWVSSVTADGRPFSDWKWNNRTRIVPWGKTLSIDTVKAVSADGSVLLASQKNAGFYTREGKVADLDESLRPDLLEGMVFHYGSDTTVTLLVPRGGQ